LPSAEAPRGKCTTAFERYFVPEEGRKLENARDHLKLTPSVLAVAPIWRAAITLLIAPVYDEPWYR